MKNNDREFYERGIASIKLNYEGRIKGIIDSNNRQRLEKNEQTRKYILTLFFGWVIFFFIMLGISGNDFSIFFALIAWIAGRGLAYLLIKFSSVTLDDLEDNHREITSFADDYLGK